MSLPSKFRAKNAGTGPGITAICKVLEDVFNRDIQQPRPGDSIPLFQHLNEFGGYLGIVDTCRNWIYTATKLAEQEPLNHSWHDFAFSLVRLTAFCQAALPRNKVYPGFEKLQQGAVADYVVQYLSLLGAASYVYYGLAGIGVAHEQDPAVPAWLGAAWNDFRYALPETYSLLHIALRIHTLKPVSPNPPLYCQNRSLLTTS